MSLAKRLLLSASFAACPWFACMGVADASPDAASAPADAAPPLRLTLDPAAPAYLDAGAASDQRPLMSLLGRAGLGDFLSRNNINVYGWVEGSYNFNLDNPEHPRLNLGHLFDEYQSDLLINQFQVNVERKVDLTSRQVEVGGRVDLLYGSDATFIHSSGILDHYGSEQYQFDIPQIYADVAIPVGNGLRVRVGKFEFFKFTDPNASPLFSHTFLYSFAGQASGTRLTSTLVGAALPFSLTGITGYYEFTPQMNLEAGIGRGYDQSLRDNNGAINAFGRVNYRFSDQTKASLALITGPEISGDNSHYRTAIDLSGYHSISEDLSVLLDANFGIQARPALGTVALPNGAAPDVNGSAKWYGISGTGLYKISPNVTATGRLEWYRDEEGYTSGFDGRPGGGALTLYEATAGLTITPFPDSQWGAGMKVRPEIRYDYGSKGYFFNTSSVHSQWIASVDVIYNF